MGGPACLKAMFNKAIFLATCNATMANKKPFKLQRGCHPFATFFATSTIVNKMAEISRERKMSSEWPILTRLRCKLLKGCHTQAACLATLLKVERRSTFLATLNATIATAKWDVTSEKGHFHSLHMLFDLCQKFE